MFCDRARALQNGKPFLLDTLLPEVKDVAKRLRLRILDSRLLPVRPVALTERARPTTRRGRWPKLQSAARV